MTGIMFYSHLTHNVPGCNCISNYLLMTEQEAQTDWHQDFTGTSVFFLLFVEGKERIFHRRANPESPTAF